MKIKRLPADDWFSKLVRLRADHTCERCGKYCGESHENGRLDCSHIFSRRHKATRWHPDNAVAHCFTCHQELGENPIIFQKWAKMYLGEDVLESIETERQRIVKCGKKLEKEIAQGLKQQYFQMIDDKACGREAEFSGYIFP